MSQNSTLRSLVSAVQKDAANAAEQLSSDAQSASGEPYDDGKDVVSAFNALSRTRPLDLMKVLVKMKNVSAHFVSAHCSS